MAVGRASAHRAREVRPRPANRQSLVRRARHAAPVRLCRRQRLLPQPLPAIELLIARRPPRARSRAASLRPTPAARCFSAWPRSSSRCSSPTTATSTSTRSAARPSPSPRRRCPSASTPRRWRRSATMATARHRRQRIDRASPPRRPAQVPVQLRRRVRHEEPLPAVLHRRRRRRGMRGRRDAGRPPGLHAQLRHDRAVSRAGGVSAGRRSVAAQAAQLAALHPQLSLEAGARLAHPRLRQGRRRPSEIGLDRSDLRVPPRQRLRGWRQHRRRPHRLPRRRIIDQLYLARLRASDPIDRPGA